MPFDYQKMRNKAQELLSKAKFGGTFTLKKLANKVYDPITKKQVQVYEEYLGDCVRKTYQDEGLGNLKDIVQAGDLVFVCTMKDPKVIPVKNSDKIIFAGVTYNILEVEEVNPNGELNIVHKCYARKISQ